MLNLFIWKIRTACVRQLAFIPAYIGGLQFAQPRDRRPFEGSWQERGDTEERVAAVGGQPVQVYGSERKVKAAQACDAVSFPGAVIIFTVRSN